MKKPTKFGGKKRYADGGITAREISDAIAASRPAPTQISVADITPSVPNLRGSSNRDNMSFGAAFRDAREGGESTFQWRGRSYSTKTREEAAPRRQRARSTSSPTPPPTASPRRNTPPPATPRTPPPTARRTPDIPRSVRTTQSEAQLARALSGMGVPRRAPPGAAELRAELERRSRENRNAKGGKVKKMAKGGSIDGIAKRGKTRAKRKK